MSPLDLLLILLLIAMAFLTFYVLERYLQRGERLRAEETYQRLQAAMEDNDRDTVPLIPGPVPSTGAAPEGPFARDLRRLEQDPATHGGPRFGPAVIDPHYVSRPTAADPAATSWRALMAAFPWGKDEDINGGDVVDLVNRLREGAWWTH